MSAATALGNRPAQIVAATVEVHCPHCGEPQPSPDNGSDAWLPEQVKQASGKRECVACDLPFRLTAVNMARVLA